MAPRQSRRTGARALCIPVTPFLRYARRGSLGVGMDLFGISSDDLVNSVKTAREGIGAIRDAGALFQSLRDKVTNKGGAAQEAEARLAILQLASDMAERLFKAHDAQAQVLDALQTLQRQLEEARRAQDERDRYQLVATEGGALVLELKQPDPKGEPLHYLCPDCLEDGKKRILQPITSRPAMLECRGCTTVFHIQAIKPPRGPSGRGESWKTL
jgi:hypothetical protein